MKRSIALAVTAALSVALAGAAAAAPETYTIEGSHTLPRFQYNHLGFSTQVSRFNKTSGTIVIDRAAKTGSVDVTIDVSSVDTGSPQLDEHLQGADFFDAAKYPAITYKSSVLRFKGDQPVEVDGNLTIKGITKPVVLKIESLSCKQHPITKKDACGADAVAKIKRSQFGLDKYAPAVSDELLLFIPVEAFKPAAEAVKP